MVRTEHQLHLDVHDREASQRAAGDGFAQALFNRRNEFLRDHAAGDVVDEQEIVLDHRSDLRIGTIFSGDRRQLDHDVTVLTLTTGLLGVLVVRLDVSQGDGFAVGHLRRADVGFNVELALQAVDDDVQVQLAHARDDGLAGFFVGLDAERRIFLRQATQRQTHLFLVRLGLRLDGHRDHRLRERHALQDDRRIHGAQGVTGGGVLQAHGSSDVTSQNFLDFLAVVRVHLQDAADALLLALHRVQHGVATVQGARVDTEEGQRADERVGDDLEGQRRERRLVVRLAGHFDGVVVNVHALHVRHVDRRRQQLDHAVQHGLHALVLEGRAAVHRHDLGGQGTGTQRVDDFGLGQLFAAQVLFHQLFAGFGSGLDHELASFFRSRLQIGRDVAVLELHALRGFIPVDGLHLQQVDNALEVVFSADRQLHRHGNRAQLGLQLADDLLEVGTGAVHLVDERDAWHVVLVGLTPHGFRLRLHATDGAQDEDGTVEHAQRALNFDGEVDVPRGVDDVEAVLRQGLVHALPERGGGSGLDRDATLLLLLHPVHGGGAVVHFTDLVALAGVEQDALGRGGLAGIDVSHDAEVTVTLDGSGTGHGSLSDFLDFGWPNAAFRRPSDWRSLSGTARQHAPKWCCPACFTRPSNSPAVVGECLVGFGHAVGFFALLDGAATVFRGVDQFSSQLLRHGVLAALARGVDQPAHGQGHLARRTHFDRHLVGGTTDAARLDFDRRSDVVQSLLHQFNGVGAAVLLGDHVHGAVHDLLGDGLLAALHDHVDETGDGFASVLRIGQDGTLRSITLTRHCALSLCLRTLGAVLGTGLATLGNAGGVERATNGVVTHTRQVLDATAADQDHGVLLQVVAFTTDVGNHFFLVGQADLGNLAQSRVRLLRSGGVDTGADATALRALVERRRGTLVGGRLPRLADQLVDRRHQ